MKTLARRPLVPLSFLACSAAAAQDHSEHHGLHASEARFDAATKPELDVRRAKTGHLLVRPEIDGHEAGWFIFDTGAGICVVSTPLSETLELTPAGDVQAEGLGGDATTRGARAEELALGPLTLRGVPLMLTDLSFLREPLGVEIAGVIGYGVLARCVVELDLETPRIALHDPAAYALASGAWSPLELDHLVPTVPATFEGHAGRFHLDIGANAALTFQEPTVRRLGLLAGRELVDAKLGGVGGSVAAKRGRLASFELAGTRFDGLEATFAVEAKGIAAQEGHDGSIGTPVLRSFLLTLDYPGARISLRPRGG